jgi:protein-tyrosine phosphatase
MKSFVDPPSRIVDQLYIGNAGNAADSGFFKTRKIRNVLNVTKYTKNHFPRNVNYMRIPISDTRGVEFGDQIRKGIKFIEDALSKEEPVLVHCVMGCSRSVTVVVGYIMNRYKMTREEAYDLVKSRRTMANPNMGFWNELKKLETRR